MTGALLVTAGDGPAECCQAVGHILARMTEEADMLGLSLTLCRFEGTHRQHRPKSAVVVVEGAQTDLFQRQWVGTIQWRMQSQIRAHHKRANWFMGVFQLDDPAPSVTRIAAKDVQMSTLRAGGPGGQHQNTTDSAVRAVHQPTGLCVVARDGRSQHQNKALALKRLQILADAAETARQETEKSARNQLHRHLARGNPVRVFKGPAFTEIGTR